MQADGSSSFCRADAKYSPLSPRAKNLDTPVDVKVQDLSLEFFHRSPLTFQVLSRVQILQNVSARIYSGQLTAVMGASGSGKTSFLDVLASRATRTGTPIVTGSVWLNEEEAPDVSAIAPWAAYVTQEDELPPELTVHEALSFAARIKLPEARDPTKCLEIVEKLIQDLGLQDCVQNRIGAVSGSSERISGGERRRVSIALQLMSNPSILLLDEPSSGLDSTSAHKIITYLHRLAKTKKKTVLCSIHQPSAKTFALFDRLLLLSKGGRIAFEGPVSQALPHFQSLGFYCPPGLNPADFFLDVTTGARKRIPVPLADIKSPVETPKEPIESGDELRSSILRNSENYDADSPDGLRDFLEIYALKKQKENEVVAQAKKMSHDSEDHLPTDPNKLKSKVSLSRQIYTLIIRESIITWRNKATALGFMLQSAIIGLCLGVIFFQTGSSASAVTITKKAVLYLSSSNQPYVTTVFAVYTACQDFKIFDQERADKLYNPAAYVFSHYIAQIPVHIISPLIYYGVLYFMTGLRTDNVWYPVFYLIVGIILQLTGVALGWFCAAISRSFDAASLLNNFLFTFTVLSGGFVVSYKSIPPWVAWWKYFSFQGYAFELFAINEYKGNEYHDNGITIKGDDVLQSLDFPDDYRWPLVYLCLVFVGLQGGAFLLLIFVPHQPHERAFSVPPQSKKPSESTTTQTSPEVKNEEHDTYRQDEDSSYIGISRSATPAVLPTLRYHHTPLLNSPQDVSYVSSNVMNAEKLSDFAADRRQSSGLEGEPVRVSVEGVGLIAVGKNSDHRESTSEGTIILDQIDAQFPAGDLSVILGPSGSGKTSLMNVIAGRCPPSTYKIDGCVRMNGHVMEGSSRGMVSFMRQHPELLPGITVLETLRFAALLADQSPDAAERVIEDLGLTSCANTLVALCSGGEKRRTAIGSYLVSKPAILLLDEPTTGLDAASSVRLVSALRALARTHATIIATVHQPRPELFEAFSHLLLLTHGRLAYAGSACRAIEHFSVKFRELKRPSGISIPEFLLDLMAGPWRTLNTVDSKEEKKSVGTKTETEIALAIEGGSRLPTPYQIVQAWRGSSIDELITDFKELGARPKVEPMRPFVIATPILFRRSLINFSRQPLMVLARLMQIGSFGIILSLYFWRFKKDQIGILNYMNTLWEINSLVFVGMLNCTASFPGQRDVFHRERADGRYSTLSFFSAYCALELPFGFLCSMVFVLMLTYSVGLREEIDPIVMSTIAVFFVVSFGESVGMLYCAAFKHVGFALSLISVNLGLFHITSGFLTVHLTPAVDALTYINPLRFSSDVLVNAELSNVRFSCAGTMVFGRCVETGEEVRSLYGFTDNYTTSIIVLKSFTHSLKILTYFIHLRI
ncbi:hypothetical protein AAMO2058_000285700 [Amorphochlora amoebiformis]